ncbi:MAG: hypothetical protein ATN35_10665 [Epulopiscium sp. Nele67-Bin004]|nr:MAG: hypothetical protein ATN35_10665 [Epulopiscium sp. Nele67-Bin004]
MKRVIKWVLAISLLVTLTGALILGYFGYEYYQAVLEDMPLRETMYQIQSQPGYTNIEDISTHFLNSIIAVEDRRFLSHGGIDIVSIARAALTNLSANQILQGGSTITQQLAKNIFFSSNQTFLRKSAELFMAFHIERVYSKSEILELYCNVIYLGQGCYGIEEASYYYFGKSSEHLTVDEAAYLAGFPQAPSLYSGNSALAMQRQAVVLQALDEVGYLFEGGQ